MTKPLYITGSICLLAVACAAIWGAWQWKLTNEQVRSLLSEAQWTVAENRKEVRAVLSELKLTTNQVRRDVHYFAEDLNSPQQQRARLVTMRAGESVAALAARIEQDTLPRLNASVDASTSLIANADKQLNGAVLPETAKLLASLRTTSEKFGVDSTALLAEIVKLTEKGETSIEAVNKVLTSPEWMSILQSVDGTAKNIEATTAAMPGIAQSLEKVAETSAKWSKAILIAQLLSTVARAFIP